MAMFAVVCCSKGPEGTPADSSDPSTSEDPSGSPSQSDDPSEFVMEAVDLGLDVLWANCNVGATTPEGYGNHYAWGDTEVREDYSWASYIFCTDAHDGIHFTTYSEEGAILAIDHDAAHAVLGGKWHMPSAKDFEDLRTKCTWEWETVGTVNGYRVTSKVDTKVSIFLPAAGFIESGNKVSAKGSFGKYWANELRDDAPALAENLTFYDKQVATDSYPYRYLGFSVRAVQPRDN